MYKIDTRVHGPEGLLARQLRDATEEEAKELADKFNAEEKAKRAAAAKPPAHE